MTKFGQNKMVTDKITCTIADTLAVVAINRPEKLNALNLEMWGQVAEAFKELDGRSEIRCVILEGSGDKAFGAGADISEFGAKRKNSRLAKEYGTVMHAAMDSIRNCRHPVLAKIKGLCVGGSLELALVCDLRLAGESSRFGVPITKLGFPRNSIRRTCFRRSRGQRERPSKQNIPRRRSRRCCERDS